MLSFIFIYYLIFLFLKSNCNYYREISFSLPHHFKMKNGNNLLVCTKGIYIFDELFKEELSHQNFENEVSSVEDSRFITIKQFENNDGGYISILTKDKFYFLKSDGSFIFKDNININNSGLIYNLVLYKTGSNYYFILGYLNDNSKFNLGYYYININSNRIEFIKNYEANWSNDGYNSVNISNAFNCNIMHSSNEGNVLACFYYDKTIKGICSISFDISNNFSIYDNLRKCETNIENNEILYIQLEVNEEKYYSLIGLSNLNNNVYYIYFDINSVSFSNYTFSFYHCETNPNKPEYFNLKYISQNKEYLLSCFGDSIFKVSKFDNNMNRVNAYDNGVLYFCPQNNCHHCENFFYNIFYLPPYESYNCLIDTNCQQTNNASFHLITSLTLSSIPLYISDIYHIDKSSSFPSFISYSILEVPISFSSIINGNSQISTIYKSDFYNITNCSNEFFYKNSVTNKCEKSCLYEELINDICIINNLNENNILNITHDMEKLLSSLQIDEKTNIVIKGENAIYQIISSEVMNENKDKNLSIIDFGECKQILKDEYGINYILILKVDIHLSSSNNIVLKYEAYNPKNLTQLDLSKCNDAKINTYLPYSLPSEFFDLFIRLNNCGYDLNNPNDSFYKDLCVPFTTENKTDILLSDRINSYYKNLSLCEDGCTYKKYDYTYKKIQCECIIKTEMDRNINNIEFYGNLLVSSIMNIENFSNIKILKCYKLVFSQLGQKNNIGSIIFIILIIIFIVLMILFFIYFKREIIKILNIIIEKKYLKKFSKENSAPTKKTRSRSKKSITKYKKLNPIIINNNLVINNIKNSYLLNKKTIDINEDLNKENFNKFSDKEKNSIFSKSMINYDLNNENQRISEENIKKKSIQVYNFNEEEINSLSYEEAIKYDKRTFFQYYYSILKYKHTIFFTFFSKNDYNIFIIKLTLFLFSFSLYFSTSALFFTDDTMHKIFENQGNIALFFNILNIIYSSLISTIITLLIKKLALSNKDILKIKKIKNRKLALTNSVKLIKKLYIRFSIYYIITFIFLIFFWYFISAFCAVYKNTQILLLRTTLISYLVSLLYPLALNTIPALLRIMSLRDKSHGKKCIYSFSYILHLI